MRTTKTAKALLTTITFLWLGLVIGLSFIETPLKFQAPGMTRELAFGLGKLIFNTLNKIEWLLSISVLVCLFSLKGSLKFQLKLTYSIILIIVLVQTFLLLPELTKRVDMILSGKQPPESMLHIFFIISEVSKVLLLAISGWLHTKRSMN